MGNLETKLTPYYAISNENIEFNNNGKDEENANRFLQNGFQTSLPIWKVRKANFNNEFKNATLFEFNCVKYSTGESRKIPSKQLTFALNQIKILKTLRHPGIVKYYYSEEPHHANLINGKCLLITESIRPLSTLIGDLSNEQIRRGIYNLTSAISFLHEKVSMSHNNLNQSCIYLNSKQTWKLNDFELAISFSNMNKENLKQIYEFKNKNAITPEEEAEIIQLTSTSSSKNFKYDLDLTCKQSPHSIDAYGWAMILLDLLPKRKSSNQKGLYNRSYSNIDETEHVASNHKNESDLEYETFEELALYLSKDPTQRPKLKWALELNFFDLYKSSFNESDSTSDQVKTNTNIDTDNSDQLNSGVTPNENTNLKNSFDLFKITNLNELDKNFTILFDYLKNSSRNDESSSLLTSSSNQTNTANKIHQHLYINEKLIDFLLSPFMFFSSKVRNHIFPGVFIPKEEFSLTAADLNKNFNKFNINNFYFMNYKNNLINKFSMPNVQINDDESSNKETFNCILAPFIGLDKYKAFVLPKILNLFSMHSTQIRIALLDYFPFYIHHINDKDTLKYEILPELLLGLKDKNDHLVSLTFSCLSIMVQILGSEIVVGKDTTNGKQQKLFSDNLPKINTIDDYIKSTSTTESIKLNSNKDDFHLEENKSNSKLNLNNSAKFKLNELNEFNLKKQQKQNLKIDLNLSLSLNKNKLSSATSLDEDIALNSLDSAKSANKLFSDSMIALHDENESNEFKTNETKSNELDLNNDDEWSNDFGWSNNHDQQINSLNNKNYYYNQESSASLVSLAGSDLLNQLDDKSKSSSTISKNNDVSSSYLDANNPTNPQSSVSLDNLKLNYNFNSRTSLMNDQMGSEYDIKSIKIIKKKQNSEPKDDLIESFLNEMQPVIKTTTNDLDKLLNKSDASETNSNISPIQISKLTSNSNSESENNNSQPEQTRLVETATVDLKSIEEPLKQLDLSNNQTQTNETNKNLNPENNPNKIGSNSWDCEDIVDLEETN